MFFSETLLPEPSQSEQRSSNNWSESSSSSKFNKSRRNKHPRKKQRTNSQDYTDLLVFGYEAKTFRDNEMSQKVNKGELLIPWRGETENKILLDRYDVRNLLDERDQFKKVAYTMTRKSDDVEQEKLCDEERWADLDSEFEDLYDLSEEERDSYIEEKRKRKKMLEEDRVYSYDYSDENLPYEEEETVIVSKSKSNYAPKYSAPNGMITPSDNRIDEIIERTAKFINSSTDPQMEIVIQAKQSNNPSFSFLNKDDPLYPYYRHVRLLLQTGLFAYGGNDDGEGSSSNEDNGENENDSSNDRSEGNKSTDDYTEDEKRVKLERTKAETSKSNASNSSAHNTASRPSRHFGPVVVPPPDLKIIIDKMSAYVAKNGQSLEAKVREKHIDDPRFSFLLPWNEFHPYYKQKIQEEKATIEPAEKETVDDCDDDDTTEEE
ncbi:splicing factor, suppressor of white-apricot homolog isoform X1 [Rhizophagus clarus]|uniref:Splicing factor, suppressor of white-apricot homolog isoform X1 n=2 Tax=Rhizophagus clarus TaxID=94130 RepID=A0A8H3L374_9GLOM|nr:splicing factor, suppressor of white-apricot homolog isoform X1 [Rhizophagus clarus]